VDPRRRQFVAPVALDGVGGGISAVVADANGHPGGPAGPLRMLVTGLIGGLRGHFLGSDQVHCGLRAFDHARTMAGRVIPATHPTNFSLWGCGKALRGQVVWGGLRSAHMGDDKCHRKNIPNWSPAQKRSRMA
jgi:hypothetical protein